MGKGSARGAAPPCQKLAAMAQPLLVDAVTDDDLTPRAIELLYGLKARPTRDEVLKRAEAWRPFRMWAVVLLNVWLRSQPADVIGRRQTRRRPK